MNIQDTIAILPTMHNHIGIYGDDTLCRLIGYHSDPDDSYYHLSAMNPKNEFYGSMVGAFISLKDKYGDRYEHMDNMFALNGAPPTPEFKYRSSDISCSCHERGCNA